MACGEKTTEAETPKKTTNQGTELSELDWMLGKWKREDTGELALWSKKENSYFGGMKVTLNNKEQAVIQGVLALEGRKDGIFFSTKEKGQRNANRVEYKMSNTNFDAPKFTNPNQSYPKHISYMKIGNDKIKVEETGVGGKGTSYYFVREI
ncbi:hypothetical protein GCM10007940_27080 [Portibacter lacus]|uniref:Uncharacterized protein n=2 Tax=Portibacter lacus TaxID=1099794 RepID=A0AA37STZ1_9BACT|nr:hypothetical protein GCM10007940_27080 [Portibacter lacus]